VDLPDDEAATLCREGMARPVTVEAVPVEAAVADAAAVEVRPLTTATGPGRRRTRPAATLDAEPGVG
jgi:hypothetical protein